MKITKMKLMRGVYLIICYCFLVALSNQSFAQAEKGKIFINGKEFNESKCQKLKLLQSITLPERTEDSITVQMYLASGTLAKGGKYFPTISQFNAFDIATWLKSERRTANTVSMDLDENGDSKTKLIAREGDRLVILIYSGKDIIIRHALIFCSN